MFSKLRQRSKSGGGRQLYKRGHLVIDGRDLIWSVACLNDGKHFVSGGEEGKIRRWRAEDGMEVGTPMDVGSTVCNIAVSRDGKWIVSATKSGLVKVWNAKTHEKVTEFTAHSNFVRAVDVSPDATRIATGSDDWTVCIWSLSTGQQLLGPLQHDHCVVAAKISPDGSLVATATFKSVRVYGSRNGCLLLDVPIEVNSRWSNSLVWVSYGKQLFALSREGYIHCLDVSTGTTLSKWPIHSTQDATCIALANNGTFIAASADRTVSFWNTMTQEQIGSVIEHAHEIWSMAISENYELVTGGDKTISLRSIWDILPLGYFDDDMAKLEKTVRELRIQISEFQQAKNNLIQSLHVQEESSSSSIARFEETNQELRNQLAKSQHAADEQQERLNETIRSLRSDLHARNNKTAHLEQANEELQHEADSLIRIIRAHEQKHQCEALYAQGRIYDAVESAIEMANTIGEDVRENKLILGWLAEFTHRCIKTIGDDPSSARKRDETETQDERAQWERGFRERCVEKLEKLGDTARDSQEHEEAIGYYSNALLLDPTNLNDILLKRSNELIELNPSSHEGYEEKHAALQGMGCYSKAFEAFTTMLSKLEQSSDPRIRDLRHKYVDATSAIRKEVEEATSQLPHVLIDTETGHLYDKTRQAAAFEELPIYDELRSSMTTGLDYSRIEKEVKEFYRYAMLSHKWQSNEPTFQHIENNSIYNLPARPVFEKLRNFCKLVAGLRFKWAWSDTCCVNQLDKGVQQESIVAMFRWYRGSSLTIVHLLGVLSESQKIGCLWRSIWNTRGWTYQEYVASEVVQFYTEDWKPYLGLNIFNHKESPTVLSEMEQAMNFATKELGTLQPGLGRAREKLYLASGRQTTREEDMAYSLFGIFDVVLPVIYGEGNQAVGRLLEHILTRSDDVTLLAWTGRSGSHHSYLPADLTAYNQIMPPHVPPFIATAEMDGMITSLHSSVSDLSLTVALYNRLYDLPPLSLVAGRLRLPGIVFPLADLVPLAESVPESSVPVYHATTPIIGDVEIKTTADLSGMEGLLLMHPWISPLLDRDFSCGTAQFDLAMRALRLIVRLRQPFGALLLAPMARAQYRRVATDSLIMVRVREETSLSELMDGIRTIDIQ